MNLKIDEIKNVLSNINLKDISLLSGNSGISLFELYLSKIQNNEKLKEKAISRIEKTFSEIKKTIDIQFSYCLGLAGIGWLLEFANHNNLHSFNTNLILEDIDDYLSIILKYNLSINNWDFLHGAIGIGYYFLTRVKKNKKIFKSLELLIIFLEKTAIKYKGDSIFWKTNDNEKHNKKDINISLSHGNSSIIMFLLKAKQKNIFKERVEKLIFPVVNFILSQEIDKEKIVCYFPMFSIESENDLYSRLAWCYGDLGIASTIYNVGKTFNKQDLKDKSIEILLFAAEKRRDLEQNFVKDAGLCHGTAGIAAIFYRMWWNTRMSKFKNAADYWIEQTLKMARFSDGLAGYKAYHGKDNWVNEHSILEGIAGIGLMLASYYYEIEPTWDECLLLS